jgi:hypothetical protein
MNPEVTPDIETGLLAGPDSPEISERHEKCWKPLIGFLYLLLIFGIIGIIIFAMTRAIGVL